MAQPRPGRTRLPSSCARRPLTPMTRQTFSCSAMSTRIDTAMANANAAPSSTVKAVVWVMKPGPIAEVAMRNIAPSSVERVLVAMREPGGDEPASTGVRDWPDGCVMAAPRLEERLLRSRPVGP